MIKNQIIRKTAIFPALIFSSLTYAEQNTAVINVSAKVLSACTITTSDISFGNYDQLSTNTTTANSNISLYCVKGTTPTISINSGINSGATGRRLKKVDPNVNGGFLDEYLEYKIYKPNAGANGTYSCPSDGDIKTEWGTAVEAKGFQPTLDEFGRANSISVCGMIEKEKRVSPGDYSDQLIVTTSF